MKRFIVYMETDKDYEETVIGEGIEFSNENVAVFEFLTSTILILDSTEFISKHYETVGNVKIKWIDYDLFQKIIH